MKKRLSLFLLLGIMALSAKAQKTCFANYSAHTDTTLTAHFFDSSTYASGTHEYFSWNFGDSTAADTSKNPRHTFAVAGTYNVCETIWDSLKKCITTHCYFITVGKSTNKGCFAYFTAKTDTTLSAFFSEKSYTKSGKTIRKWTFGDGDSSASLSPHHTYIAGGTYYVCEYIMDSISGCTTAYCTYITVGKKSAHNCKAFNTPYVDTSLTVRFVDSSYTVSGSTLYTWSFGDSTSSNLRNPSHSYSKAGYYSVCEFITDSLTGCTSKYCYGIFVPRKIAVCNLTFTAITDTTLTVKFHDSFSTSGTRPLFYWNYGDSTTDSIANPTHTFARPGMHFVCAEILTRDSTHTVLCSYCLKFYVGKTKWKCGAKFTVDSLDSLKKIIYITNHSGGALKTLWSFGDGDTSWSAMPTHNYGSSGSFDLCLTVFCKGGGTDTYCDSITGAATHITRTGGGYAIKVTSVVSGTNELKPVTGRRLVYPNPVNSILNIYLPENVTSGTVYVKNVLGQVINTQEVNTLRPTLDMSTLAQGIYIIQLQTTRGALVTKVIKQ